MKPQDALKIIGGWIARETAKRKYTEVELIELSEALILLKKYFEEVD